MQQILLSQCPDQAHIYGKIPESELLCIRVANIFRSKDTSTLKVLS